VGNTVDQLLERLSVERGIRRSSAMSSDEWLGPESHMPNLRRELRQRNAPARDTAGAWMAGALFMAGVAMGSLAALLIIRSRRIL
jgi:hypothetical protein